MSITRVIVFAAGLSACGALSAQSAGSSAVVNKCTAADGSVIYSDKPCSGKEKAEKVDTSAALRAGSGGHVGEIATSVADTDCRGRARQSAYGENDAKIAESNQHIADYQQRRAKLATLKAYAGDGSGQLIDDPAARQEMGKLDAAIVKEREFQQGLQKSAEAAYESALKACAAEAAKNAPVQPAVK